ncbi:YtxH domain-containing protein [Sediminitomix flava]|uniref:Gas vesicle protein n=1 Tax=Sediminitomix flava TaxID=379075 RepID=A0A315Z0D7_SEDFL|nr:YtxH domain-containing protein [Sediminitomix flava]PWJ36103.1 gas vesicle protein [Sediminitomix flava]
MSKKNTGSTLLAFLAGAAVGAVVGVLYAPEEGKSTRDKLSYQLDKYKEKLQQMIDDLVKQQSQPVSEAKSEGQKVIDDAIKHAEQLMNEVDALKSKISSGDSES